MTPQELAESYEVRIYPIREEAGDWAMGIFPKNGKRLAIKPHIFHSRIDAAASARVLAQMSGMEIVEHNSCQDTSYNYDAVIMRRLIFKGFVIGALVFLVYYLAVRFLV